jgi:Asp-tRNA(Asn)/Glu-tRNA(Gln) amidotransferase B subunit
VNELVEIINRQAVELAELKMANAQLMQMILQLKEGTLTLDQLDIKRDSDD